MIIQKGDVWQCDICGYQYREKEWAEKRSTWCTEHHICNLEIIAHGTPGL